MEASQIECRKPENSPKPDEPKTSSTLRSVNWIPRSGNGPVATIPFDHGIEEALLPQCGLSAFGSARAEMKALAREYAARAVSLVARARADRMALMRELQGCEPEFRPYRARLCLELDVARGHLYLVWRVATKRRGRYTRERASQWSGQSDLSALIAGVHPAEEQLIRRIESEAVDIRLRWFALVRQVHYMNVTEELRYADLTSGRSRPTPQVMARAMQWVRDVLGYSD